MYLSNKCEEDKRVTPKIELIQLFSKYIMYCSLFGVYSKSVKEIKGIC